jgi:nuclear RNA export factor
LGPTAVIKILGLKASKAAANRDGGLRGLLEFLERKASSRKKVTIKKVCARNPSRRLAR